MEAARDYVNTDIPNHQVIGGFLSPVGDAYEKAGLESSKNRGKMVSEAVLSSPWISVSTWEMDQDLWTPTKRVIEHIRMTVSEELRCKGAPITDPRCMLVCGGDLLWGFSDSEVWVDDDLQAILTDGVLVMPRDGTDIDQVVGMKRLERYRDAIFVLPYDCPNAVSSTLVRRLIGERKSIRYLVPDRVREYIEANGLYSNSSD
eukprot:CAMPEP_0197526692 /NCGR_PEP_ID=MMETSP1318-20131121/18909_1 /TAXON_ID=552666 /ORGANISM="Partenskyella glossopodia, Strain RCC365" /LENGTH=202 /DNA_ID=CAMNT_0043080975 /DNA_START=185 /DNA_END=793 /DNA_ORIENTATION=+